MLLGDHGEWLPLTSSPGGYWLFNVLTVVDCLDKVKSRCEFFDDEPSRIMAIDQYEFDPARITDSPIFRIPDDPMVVFATSAFVNTVRSEDLHGFSFYKAWPLPARSDYRKFNEGQTYCHRDFVLQSIIIVLSNRNQKEAEFAGQFLASVDRLLVSRSISQPYLGRIEGEECHDNARRIFISCPCVDTIRSQIIEALHCLPRQMLIAAYVRFGHFTNPKAREEPLDEGVSQRSSKKKSRQIARAPGDR
ncbi:MAG: hypothetical protein L6R48_13510 [Planctomycetes bacterium]|nr:hypothetical protein [Planctomycetota bacterium]